MLQPLNLLLYVFYVVVFLCLIYKAKFFVIDGVKRSHFAFFFLLKVVAGIILTLVYTYYYTDPTKADIYRYFNDSKIISSLLFSHPLDWFKIITGFGTYDESTFVKLKDTLYFSHPGSDIITNNTLLIRIISVFNYFSFSNIYIDTLLLNCLTFTALVALFKALRPYFSEFPQILYWPLFLMPSVTFWSSGLLKEGVLIIAISIYVFANLNLSGLFKNFLLSVFAIWLVALTKIYVGAIMVFCGAFLFKKDQKMYSGSSLALKLGLYVAFIVLAWQYGGDYMCNNIVHKRNEFIELAATEHSGSILDSNVSGNDCNELARLMPSALINSIFRPFLWDKGPLLQLLFALENSALLLLQMLLLIFFFRWPQGQNLLLLLFFLSFAILNYIAIGLTVPVLGAIVHYRVVAMPFLLLSVLLMTDLNKLKLYVFRYVHC